MDLFSYISASYHNSAITFGMIEAVLFMVTILTVYEFLVYRYVSHRAFYNRSFNICIAIIPFFIATIILCLQSNVVITLGTIGALAIIRFRTAVKDPVDMVYILWSVYIGIVCGCQLYEVAVITSVVVTVMLLVMEFIPLGRKPYILVFKCYSDDEEAILNVVEKNAGKYRVKSRNYSSYGINYVIELTINDMNKFTAKLEKQNIEQYSIIQYDSNDII